jgi:hypothetical protein
MTPEEQFRARQRSRNLVLGLVLIGFAALFYFITIARMT